jgi:triacylglycerol lipase
VNVQSAINAGLFVQFVANQWDVGSPKNNLDGMPVVNTAGSPVIPGSRYTVKKTLYACDLATDINPTRPGDEGWKTFGIVAVNDADPNDIFVAIRGTLTVWEWLQDAKFLLRPFKRVSGGGLTEDGFTDMYYSMSFSSANCDGNFITDLAALLPASARVTVAGHSLGASVATLLAFDLGANTKFIPTLYTLASPRVGDLTFSHVFNHIVPNAFRIANRLDVVPKVPPPLMYFHVGDETELVPGNDLRFDLGCEHHLTSYFHMLGALTGLGANYPIQANCLKGSPGLSTSNPSSA